MGKCPEGQTRNAKTKQCRDKLKTGKKVRSPKSNTTRRNNESLNTYIARQHARINSAHKKANATLKMKKNARSRSSSKSSRSSSLKKTKKTKKAPSNTTRRNGESESEYIARQHAIISAAQAKANAKLMAKANATLKAVSKLKLKKD
jgi:hypothetical protein